MDLMTSKPNLPTSSKKETDETKKKTSYRFELDLLKVEASSFPEYSYASLVKDIKKENGLKTSSNNQDAGDKNDAEAIARHFEAKYGNMNKGKPKKRHRHRATELVDMGYGYDDTDPFVDNSECYDEVVPSSLTTQFGGFYINSGKLEFKQISSDSNIEEDEDDEDSLPLSAHIKKRKVISTSDEERAGHSGLLKHKRIKKRKGSSELDEKRRRKLSLQGKDKLGKITTSAKKKHTKVQLLVAKAKAQQHQLNNSGSSSDKSIKSKERRLSNGDSNKTLSETGKDLLNFLEQSTSGNMSIQNIMNYDTYKNGDLLKSSDEELPTSKLSVSIPNNIRSQISSLSKIAKSNEKEGKVKFFSPDVNNLLYNIESGSQSLSNRDRLDIYQHLTTQVPCSKDTLVKRMKKLVATKQDERVRQPLLLLKEAIDRVMDQQMKDYDEECVAAQLAKLDDRNVLAASTDEDEEGTAPTNGEEKTKRHYAPRRKFKWLDHIRNLFFDVVRIKVEHFETLKNKNSQSAEDYLKAYFENEVKILWPKGWMQSRMLYKESREIHSAITGNQVKQKKVVVSGPKKASATAKVEKKNFSPTDCVSKKLGSGTPDTTKATKQLFKDQTGLSVNLSLIGDEIVEDKKEDILNRAIANAHRDLARKQPSSQMAVPKLTPKQQPVSQTVQSKSIPRQQTMQMTAPKQPNKEAHQSNSNAKLTQDLLKSMGLSVEYLKAQDRSKSIGNTTKNRNDTISSKTHDSPSSAVVKQTQKQHRLPSNEHTPHASKSNQKTSNSHLTAKSQPGKNVSSNALTKACYDQYNAELLKLARMIPGTSHVTEKSLANVFNYQVPSIPGNLDDLNKFMQLQHAALASSSYQPYIQSIPKQSKPPAANEAFRFSIKGSSPKTTDASNQNQIKPQPTSSQKSRHSSSQKMGNGMNRPNEPFKQMSVSNAGSSGGHFTPNKFIAPASPTLNHSASKLAHSGEKQNPHQNLHVRKNNVSPVSPSTVFHPQNSSSNLHPSTSNYNNKSTFSPYPGNYAYSMRANMPAPHTTPPVTQTSNTAGMSYGSYEQLLKMTPPSDRKYIPQGSIDQRDKAAMEALLSARNQGARR